MRKDEMLKDNEFGRLLASLHARKGWKQEDAAAHLGFVRHTYSDWVLGKRLPSPEQLKHIAATFKLNQTEEDELYRTAARVGPQTDNLPLENTYFTGRDTQLKRLGELLQESGTVAVTQPVSISGLGGIGKTQLALAYAHRSYPSVYRAVLLVNAADQTTLQASYDEVADLLDLPERDDSKPERRLRAVKRWLASHTNWLLIMDNADNLYLARSFLPAKPLGHIIFTTQSQIIGTTGKQIELNRMELEEGLLFLVRRSQPKQENIQLDTIAQDTRQAARELVELLGGHPLALDQAGAYIEETLTSFAKYIGLYQKGSRSLLKRRGSSGNEYGEHPDSVVVTFELSFEKASQQHPLAAHILYFCAFLQPDAIPDELFQAYEGFALDPVAFDDGVAVLQRYSLLKQNTRDKTYSLHRLVQAVVRETLLPDRIQYWRERVIHALYTTPFPEPLAKNHTMLDRLLPHALECAPWRGIGVTETLEAAQLFYQVGVWLRKRGQYKEAEAPLVWTLAVQESLLEANHLDLATSLHALAYTYRQQGKYEQAEPLFHRALTIRKLRLGAEHELTRLSQGSLWAMQSDRDRLDPIQELQFALRDMAEQGGITDLPLTAEMERNYAKYLRIKARWLEDGFREANDEPPV